MKRYIFAAALLALSLSAHAFQPRTGHWNNIPAESGRGFNIDIQDGVMVLTMYAYDQNGNAQWYIASGNMTNGQHNFSGTLDKFVNGQCNTCGPQAPQSAGNDGVISVAFSSEVLATVTLPGGRVTAIRPFNFKYGDLPQGMLGTWVFTEQIGAIGFADRYTYSRILQGLNIANASNVGASNADATAGCAYYISGQFAGKLLCFHDLSGGTVEGYVFTYGLDETYDGQYVSSSANLYPMKGMRTGSASGFTKSLDKEGPNLKALAEESSAPKAPAELVHALRELQERARSGVTGP